MPDWLQWVLMFLGGMALGGLYFSGLWFTVHRIQHEKHPAFLLLMSMVLRMVLLLIMFYFILSYGDWAHLLAALAGFIALRMMSTRSMRQQIQAAAIAKEEQT